MTETFGDSLIVLVAGAATGALGLGLPMHYAVATSIVTVIATSSAVASTNVERGTANMRLGMTLELGTTLGAIAGGLTAARQPGPGLNRAKRASWRAGQRRAVALLVPLDPQTLRRL